MDKQDIFSRAAEVLRENDRGTYTVPARGLYPFQWNWDSCLAALGQSHINEQRAWTEIETLFSHQWEDGMVPHIVFHVDENTYFPGPAVWRTHRGKTETSGITQPPVAGFVVKRLFDRARDKEAARLRVKALLRKIDRWHAWFYSARDPAGEGLAAILHPWESGRDNSIDWDGALERVAVDDLEPYERKDLLYADAAMRPTQAHYDRYIALVQRFRALGWDNTRLHDASPFRVVDPGFNAILIRSCADLAVLADEFGEKDIAAANRARAQKGLAALEKLWSDRYGQYVCFDRVTSAFVESASSGGLLPVFAAVPQAREKAISRRISELMKQVRYIVPSQDPSDPRFDAKRYWRGPVWLVVNYLIVDGLKHAGEDAVADEIVRSSLGLVENGGFAEYYDPNDGKACGGACFTWTAAMFLEFLNMAD